MAEELVAATTIEYKTGKTRPDGRQEIARLAPGEAIPDNMDESDVAELRKHKSIVTQGQYEKQQEERG